MSGGRCPGGGSCPGRGNVLEFTGFRQRLPLTDDTAIVHLGRSLGWIGTEGLKSKYGLFCGRKSKTSANQTVSNNFGWCMRASLFRNFSVLGKSREIETV